MPMRRHSDKTMPFDRISPTQLFWMRIATALSFFAVAGLLGTTAGACVLSANACTTAEAASVSYLFHTVALAQAIFFGNAAMMLLELVTKAPMRLAINVPFVAANFQVALCVGLLALVVGWGVDLGAAAPASATQTRMLITVGFALNLLFVVMTKLHWNFKENTGRELQ